MDVRLVRQYSSKAVPLPVSPLFDSSSELRLSSPDHEEGRGPAREKHIFSYIVVRPNWLVRADIAQRNRVSGCHYHSLFLH